MRSSSLAFVVGALLVGMFALLPATMVAGTEVSTTQTVNGFQHRDG